MWILSSLIAVVSFIPCCLIYKTGAEVKCYACVISPDPHTQTGHPWFTNYSTDSWGKPPDCARQNVVRVAYCRGQNPTCERIFKKLEVVSCLDVISHKLDDLDLMDPQLVDEYFQRCTKMVDELQVQETNSVFKETLQQLSSACSVQKSLLRSVVVKQNAKKQNTSTSWDNTGVSSPRGTEQESGAESSQSRNRTKAVQGTILARGSVHFNDVAGLKQAKDTLKEAIILPMRYPHLFTGDRRPWTRILLYGPPGTGKEEIKRSRDSKEVFKMCLNWPVNSLLAAISDVSQLYQLLYIALTNENSKSKSRLAQAVASEISSAFFCVSSADLVSSWVGESEKMVKELFQCARRQEGQSVIFIDEIDSICRRRTSHEDEYSRRIKTELLKQMEGCSPKNDVFVLGATNCPWDIDSAFLRRFQKRIYTALPDIQTRRSIMRLHCRDSNICLSDADWNYLAEKTDGYSGSDLSNLTLNALLQPLRQLERTQYWRKENGKMIPCDCDHIDAVHCTLQSLHPDTVTCGAVTMADFIKALAASHSTVSSQDLANFEEFTSKFGHEH